MTDQNQASKKKARPSHGGKRAGAGRKPGSGLYGEPTKVIRVPESKVAELKNWLTSLHTLPDSEQVFRPQVRSHLSLNLYSHKVVAGFPSPADDNIEASIDLNEHFIRQPETTFLVKVQGDSMKQGGIHNGDLLVVDRGIIPQDGKIVIAAIDGELTVKRLSVKSTGTWLVPENDSYEPILVRESSDLMIWGVVTSVMRSL